MPWVRKILTEHSYSIIVGRTGYPPQCGYCHHILHKNTYVWHTQTQGYAGRPHFRCDECGKRMYH